MSSENRLSQYLSLKDSALWKLLSADSAPYVIAILQTTLYDNPDQRVLKGSEFSFRVGQELAKLREAGFNDLARPAPEYINAWVGYGYLIRRFPQGASEEEYELSAATIDAIRFVANMANQRLIVTESRLALVAEALARLAIDTDPNKERRIERLKAEKERLDREIQATESGQALVLSNEVSMERIREIMAQSLELIDDFRHVLDRFSLLHRDLRQRLLILDDSVGRGDLAQEVLDGIYSIKKSEAGRSFEAFYAMLNNPDRQGSLSQSLEAVFEADYFKILEPQERDFLDNLIGTLLNHSMTVHNRTSALSKSLKNLVQSRTYRERRHLMDLITKAKKEALEAVDQAAPNKALGYKLNLTGVRFSSISQWTMFNPSSVFIGKPMRRADQALIDFEQIAGTIKSTEIDYLALRQAIIEAVKLLTKASIAQVLDLFPATQGLGSVLGLVHLAHRHGQLGQGHETVEWDGLDGVHRKARLETWYFLLERVDELLL
ncbi:MAG: DUF3375 domain-containing protein [Deltaproteobacteria bacterium]|jgi:hypothetical protein|nr:DUF3375 domain-containing protein [Deltaproteobacteria bacterium]